DKDQDAVATQIERWNEAHASLLKLKAGHAPPGAVLFLRAVLARRPALAEHGIGCGQQRNVVVVAKATEEMPRFAERAPHKQICGEMVGRVATVAAAR